MNYYEIGQRIRKIRKAYGLSQQALAERVGISTTHMSHIETGNAKLRLPVLVKLASVLEVPTDDLFCGSAVPSRRTAMEEIAQLFDSCTAQQMKIMEDVLKAAKNP